MAAGTAPPPAAVCLWTILVVVAVLVPTRADQRVDRCGIACSEDALSRFVPKALDFGFGLYAVGGGKVNHFGIMLYP